MLAHFLELDAGARVLGVQPDLTCVGLGEEMSAPVVRALDALDALLMDVLGAR